MSLNREVPQALLEQLEAFDDPRVLRDIIDHCTQRLQHLGAWEKTCTSCHVTKQLTEFHKRPQARDGHHSQCADCVNRRNRERLLRAPRAS